MWKDIPGYPGYQVSKGGKVRSLDRIIKNGWSQSVRHKGGVLKQTCEYQGDRLARVAVHPCLNGKVHCLRVHTAVLTAFVGPRPDGMEACHRDGNPANNALSNLRWDTDKANQADSKRHGTKYAPPIHFGEFHPRAKLTNAAVKEIRAQIKQRGTFLRLAKKFGVHPLTISRVYHGRAWV